MDAKNQSDEFLLHNTVSCTLSLPNPNVVTGGNKRQIRISYYYKWRCTLDLRGLHYMQDMQ